MPLAACRGVGIGASFIDTNLRFFQSLLLYEKCGPGKFPEKWDSEGENKSRNIQPHFLSRVKLILELYKHLYSWYCGGQLSLYIHNHRPTVPYNQI